MIHVTRYEVPAPLKTSSCLSIVSKAWNVRTGGYTHMGTSTFSSFSMQSAVYIFSKREYENPWPRLSNVMTNSTLPVTVLIDQASKTCFGVSTSPLFCPSLTMSYAKDHVILLTRAVGSCLSESTAFRN